MTRKIKLFRAEPKTRVDKLEKGDYLVLYVIRVEPYKGKNIKARVGTVYLCCPLCDNKQSVTIEQFSTAVALTCPLKTCGFKYHITSEAGEPYMVEV